MSGKNSTWSKHQLTIKEELFQAADKKIAELNKLGVAQGRTDISEPEQQHLPVLVDLGDFENWLRDAESYVMNKKLKKQRDEEVSDEESDEEYEEGGKNQKIEVEDILKDITVRGEIAKKCHSVMVLAPAGMGKTTLLRRIAQNLRRGKFKDLEDKLVLMLDFSPYLKEKKILSSQVLLGDLFSDWGSERMKQRYQWIIDNPEKVVFVIDSLDTLPFELDKKASPRLSNCPEYHKAATADVILRNIFAKDWFAETIIISSSCEYKVRNLHPSFRPDRCILLDGLTVESVQDLIDGFLGKVMGDEVKNYITTQCPDVWPLLSIPVDLVFSIIGFVEDGFKPKTLSGILIKSFQTLIRSSHAHVENVFIVFNKLMPLAFEGTRSLCVLFSPDCMKRFGLEPEEVVDFGAFIPQSHGQFLSTKLMQNDRFLLYFKHQTQQEALSALHVMSRLHLAEFNTFMEEEVWGQQFTVVRRLIYGTLLNGEVLEAAQELTQISDVSQKKHILIRSLRVALKKYQQNNEGTKLLELFIDFSECREEGMTELIRSSVKMIQFFFIPLSPSDVHAVAFMMKQCEYLEGVDLVECHLNDEKMKLLSKMIEQSNVKLNKFNVGRNEELGVEGAHLLGKLVRNHEVKSLGADGMSIQGCEALKKFIEGLGDAKLNKFNVGGNEELGVEVAHLLGKLVRNHDVKSLGAGGMSIQGCEALKKFIEGLGDAKLEEFNIGHSPKLGPEGAHLLGKMVKNRQVKKSLDAGHGIIHDRVCAEKFIEGLGDAKIDHLNLSSLYNTDCPQPLIRSLLDLLPHVENKLGFKFWKINESQQQELQQKLNEIGSPSLKVVIGGIWNHTTLKASLMDSTSESEITSEESDDDSVSVTTSEDCNVVAEMETETSGEASTSGTVTVIPSGTSVALEQSVYETKPRSTISAKEEAGCGGVETGTSDETSTSGTSIVRPRGTLFSPKQSENETNLESTIAVKEGDVDRGAIETVARLSAEIERRIKTESTKSKSVGAAVGVLVNFGSKVTFSREAYNKDTKVQTSVITDFSDCPADKLPIAPSIKCSPSGKLNKPGFVQSGTSDEISTSGTSIVRPRGTSFLPKQSENETNLESTTAVKGDVDIRAIGTEIERRIKTESTKCQLENNMDSSGGALELDDCTVNFPKKSMPMEIPQYATNKIGHSGPPQDKVQITRILRLNPNTEPNLPATGKLETWLASGDPNSVHIYCRKTENSEWELQPGHIRFSGSDILEFEITQFCQYCAFQDLEEAAKSSFWVESWLFYQPQTKRLANCIFPQCPMLRLTKEVERKMQGNGFLEACTEDIPLEVRIGDKIRVRMKIIRNKQKLSQEKKFEKNFQITVKFLRRNRHQAQNILLPPDWTGSVDFIHTVEHYNSQDKQFIEELHHEDRIQLDVQKEREDAPRRDNDSEGSSNKASSSTGESRTGNEASEQIVEQQGGATSNVTATTCNMGQMTSNQYDRTTQVFSKSTKD